jgi:DNA-binding XRE family transcriptional regulator
MAMGSTLDGRIAKLPAKRRAKVLVRADELIAEEMSLQDLRKAMDRTQVDVAKALDVGQDTVSRYERRTDMLLSTLRNYVQSMGGELDLIARFPNRAPIRIGALGDLADNSRKQKTRR